MAETTTISVRRKLGGIREFLILIVYLLLIASCGTFNQANSDQATLEALREADSDFTKVHPFDFYHHEISGAQRICVELQAEGFSVTVREGALEGEWLCLATLNFQPSIEKLSELRSRFEELVSQQGGEYDGWETIVISN
jgi:hypothetical protein